MERDAAGAATPTFAYVRVKRGRLTAFVPADVDGDATGESLLVDAARVLCITPDRLRLLRRDETGALIPLIDNARLSDQAVRNDHIIAAIVQDHDGCWSKPDVPTLQHA